VDAEALFEVGQQAGYDVELLWVGLNDQGDMAAVFRQQGGPLPAEAMVAGLTRHFGSLAVTGRRLATNPLLSMLKPQLIPQLRQHVRTLLAEYMAPAYIELIETIPLRPNGKVDRAALPPPAEERITFSDGFVGPQTALQKVLANIWCEVLRIKQVGIRDHFFTDLGGHSLLATQVVARLREMLQVEIPLRMLFEAPSIEALAAALMEDLTIGPTLEQVAEMILTLESMGEEELDSLLTEG
jgi:acyl carrier protein